VLSLLLKLVTEAQLQYLICICRKALEKNAMSFEWKGQKKKIVLVPCNKDL